MHYPAEDTDTTSLVVKSVPIHQDEATTEKTNTTTMSQDDISSISNGIATENKIATTASSKLALLSADLQLKDLLLPQSSSVNLPRSHLQGVLLDS